MSRNIADIPTIETLKILLERFGINPHNFNQGKTLDDLWREIEAGESVIRMNVTLEVSVAKAVIRYTPTQGPVLYLHEAYERFTNGQGRERKLGFSMAEKFKTGEMPFDAIVRGIEEELGIKVPQDHLHFSWIDVDAKDSTSYPGLQASYKSFWYTARLTDEQFKPDGYREETERKLTVFEWRDHLPQKTS